MSMEALAATVEKIAKQASNQCGLSHDVYVTLFSEMIESEFKQTENDIYKKIIEIARKHDYATRDERAQYQQEMADDGYCCHGLDEMTCPCGCFE